MVNLDGTEEHLESPRREKRKTAKEVRGKPLNLEIIPPEDQAVRGCSNRGPLDAMLCSNRSPWIGGG